jgi:predicted dehydrogenase
VLGEVCHFIDLSRFLVGAPIVSVRADAMAGTGDGTEDVAVSLGFADGSLATVAYTAQGDAAFGKERIETFAGGTVATIEDFRVLTVAEDGRVRRSKARLGQDKGIGGELEAFIHAARAGGPAPVDEAELIETSRATVAALESLRSGNRIDL